MAKKDKKYTWGDLKKFVNKLPPQELKKAVRWWGEERGGEVKFADRLEEDYVRTDEGCEPASVQDYEEGDEHYPIIFSKGTPIISVD